MTPAFLRRCCDAYGSARSLAHGLGENDRTIRRRLTGEWPCQPAYDADVARALQIRAQELRLQAEQCDALAAYLLNPWAAVDARPPSSGANNDAPQETGGQICQRNE